MRSSSGSTDLFTRLGLIVLMLLAGCSEGPRPLNELQARAVVDDARGQFAATLAPLIHRALPFASTGSGFLSDPPPVEVIAATSARAGGTWHRPGNHRLVAELPARASGVTRISNGPATLEVRSLSARDRSGSIVEGTLVYRDAYPHADSFVLAERERVEEFILLRDEQAPRRFEYEVKVVRGGGRVRQMGDVIEVLDAGGVAWLRLARPWVVDAGGERFPVVARLESGRLRVEVPAGVGNYPLLLDPGWTSTGSMVEVRKNHRSVRLQSGKVLAMGGTYGVAFSLSSAEIYDPTTGTWTATSSMASKREGHTATLLDSGKVLVVGGGSLLSAELFDPTTGKWSSAGSLITDRYGHSATLLKTGKVLIAGGGYGSTEFSSAEIYDSSTNAWTATGSMLTARRSQKETLLSSGKVLVVGGYPVSSSTPLSTAELYDPSTGTWSTTGNLSTGRSGYSVTLLLGGKVLVVGGCGKGGTCPTTTELYDPAKGTWRVSGNLATARSGHAATLLASGRVLVTGGSSIAGYHASTEIYDPSLGKWVPGRELALGRKGHTATLLTSGKVLLAGGEGSSGSNTKVSELYEPDAGTWATTGSMATGRHYHTLTPLPNGKVLVVGGTTKPDAELYDSTTGTWASAGSMATGRLYTAATLLPNGKVLVTGNSGGAVATAELYDPATGKWSSAGTLVSTSGHHTATLLAGGDVLVVGNTAQGATQYRAERYSPAKNTWVLTGNMTVVRSYRYPATLLASGKVMVTGGQNSGTKNASAELYDPVTNTWKATGSMLTGRYMHVAVRLSDGKVLVAGGDGAPASNTYLTSAELYDPATGTWSATGSMISGRVLPTATLMGRVLVTGGFGVGGATAELYDPNTGTWSPAGTMPNYHVYHAAALLKTGKVLVVGGYAPAATKAALYDPSNLATCRFSGDCDTQYCSDKICCDSACTSACKVCKLEISSKGVLGKCINMAAGSPDKDAATPCTGTYACDGNGICKKASGQVCKASGDCATGFCVDGYCCDSSCSGTCKACNVTGYLGTCATVTKGLTDTSATTPCVSPKACDGAGSCKTAQGQACTVGTECVTGACADSTCCDTACGDTCSACNVSGKAGTCSYLSAGTTDAVATTPCKAPSACDGKGACKSGLGQSCSAYGQCASAFCTDTVCCDTSCNAQCWSCSLGAKAGTCTMIPAGQTDTSGSTSCFGKKACDGKGGCKLATGEACAADSQCGTGHCTDTFCCGQACDGACMTCGATGSAGTCVFVGQGKQDAAAKVPCTGVKACDGKGACLLNNGQTCTKGDQCASGQCADSVCCDKDCSAACMTCAKPGSAGACTFVDKGLPDAIAKAPCTGNNTCDGAGTCKKAAAQKCSLDSECGTGFCADGYCCDSACDTSCWSCGLSGNQGTCSRIAALLPDTDPTGACSGGYLCDGKGQCLNAPGATCTLPGQCATGYCRDGVCCTTACDENCQTCYLDAQSKGTCKPHPAAVDPDNDCIGKDKDCGGKCDGKGKCDYPAATKTCGTGKCMACDGTGQCNRAPKDDSNCGTIDCDLLDTRCRDYHDLTTERCDTFSKCKTQNDPWACTLFTALPCSEAGPADLGADQQAGPGADRGTGADTPDEGGCNCQLGDAPAAPSPVAWMLLLLAFRRRRRKG